MRVAKNQPFRLRLRYALAGLAAAVRSEHSLRLQLLALMAAIVVLGVFRPEPIWWAVVALTGAAVISAELLNTALEHLADHLHPDSHSQIRLVKDCAAAAVFIASCGALGVAIALVVHLIRRG
jgi:undecaprenol kinase